MLGIELNMVFWRTERAFSYKTYSNDQTSSTKKIKNGN